MRDNRKEPRLGVNLEVELQVGEESASLKTRDLSNGGVYLESSEGPFPAVGTIVYLRVKQGFQGEEAPLVKAEIVRLDNDGFALRFLTD